jgi:ATP-dependent RNA helicase HelY
MDAPSFAGHVSCLTYEHRSPGEPPEAWFPTSVTRERFLAMERLARDLAILEEQFDLPRTRHPSPTFFAASFGWTAGDPLDDLLEEEELSAGDFVRNIKQVVDLARQIGETAPSSGTRRVARDAASRLLRGIVAASSSYEVGGEVPGSGDDDGLPPAARARA